MHAIRFFSSPDISADEPIKNRPTEKKKKTIFDLAYKNTGHVLSDVFLYEENNGISSNSVIQDIYIFTYH